MKVATSPPEVPDDGWPQPLVDLYQQRGVAYVRLAYLLTGDANVAEELVHDAFLASLGRWDQVREPGPYIRATLVNHCRSWGRRRALEQRHPPEPSPPAELRADELWDALNRLDERRRTAIVLRFYEDLPDEAIAEVLGCRQTTVRTAIHRGLKDLRREITP
jgi:RNA polymerase sigma-70 factor (sigma-E family)